MSAAHTSSAPFAARTIAILIGLAIVGFLSFVLLTAYADEFRPKGNGGNHALSTSATGFAGIADIVKRVHGEVRMVRRDADLDSEPFVVLTPAPNTDPEAVKRIVDRRLGLATLIILPKYVTMPKPGKPAWVMQVGTLPAKMALNPISRITEAKLGEVPAAAASRSIYGSDLETAYEDEEGAPTVAYVGDGLVMIAADPDLFDNRGLATLEGAERAIDIFATIASSDSPIAFDLTLHGFGSNPNLLKLAFEPPFLPLTLCILLAALLAGWHAMLRFGPAALPERGIAFGKRALAENGAALLRLARRRHRTGERYAALVRDTVAASTGAPAGLSGQALDAYLDKLRPDGQPFSKIAARAAAADDTRSLLAAARDLNDWKRTVTREHR